ncbi:hypothetical protein EXU10_02150 [Klebsiella quasipneumoniae subsp. similipneumoniae]|nr:hypothetical protein EXT85_04995 [Klebsiella quasipneumoniae subsp. similipneumoniae]TBO88871.1 hypothetical protein EXT88_05655 [Klebsiella quasipneumoniae subsp. similipneumoniae]TBO92467.1 hypothetical protein EXU03_10755 [Klebsiella quasipneumoniae subsp. similipneumoniae]TBP00847.1 hypothetical protein EXU08_03035 [Klebsiella quasipneumoniae subsp. similipneumoniae]TBP07479.1 hypothetical protein EXU16_12610 [Klebsiella quasipneumoniae subsp. similipneumoniae]
MVCLQAYYFTTAELNFRALARCEGVPLRTEVNGLHATTITARQQAGNSPRQGLSKWNKKKNKRREENMVECFRDKKRE